MMFKDYRKTRSCFIVGGGSSINTEELSLLNQDIIACNTALHYLLKENPSHLRAFICSDLRWLKWNNNLQVVSDYSGLKVMRCSKDSYKVSGLPDAGLHFVTRAMKGLSNSQLSLGGLCTGGAAINLAHIMGYESIYLLGFDMGMDKGKANFHDMHRARPGGNYSEFAKAIGEFKLTNVYNTNQESKLLCFPKINLKDVL